MIEKIIKCGIYLFCLSSAWSISIEQVGIFLSLFFWIIKILIKRERFISTSFSLPLTCFIISTIFAGFVGVNLESSMNGNIKTIGLMLIFPLILHNITNEKEAKNLLIMCIISGITQSIYAIYIGYKDIFDPSILKSEFRRIAGTCSHPIFFAEIIGICSIITITFLIFEKKKIYILGIIPMIIALVWSSTRSVWIGFVIVLLFLAFLKEKRILILFICLLIIFVLFSILLPQTKVIERVGSIFNIEYQTNKERIAMWAHGIKIMKDYPLGIGVHNVDKVYPLYKKEEEKNQAHLHNNFIQIGVERGILGLICFIWLIIHAIAILTYSYFHSKNEKSKMILLSILVSFIFFIITGFTEYNFGTSRVIMLIWFLLGIGIKLCENSLK